LVIGDWVVQLPITIYQFPIPPFGGEKNLPMAVFLFGQGMYPAFMSVSDLKKLLAQPSILVAPGAADALTARLVEDAGFAAVYVSGAGIANTQFAIPDIGLLTMTEMLEAIRRIVAAVGIPLIADADTGYGTARNVVRTVQAYEAAGVAALQVEDQVTPKISGHFSGKEVVTAEEMSRKIEAAAKARNEMLIIARTDSQRPNRRPAQKNPHAAGLQHDRRHNNPNDDSR
jgi:2-methylisocitrate lyase-like PEP mutase family enzyme